MSDPSLAAGKTRGWAVAGTVLGVLVVVGGVLLPTRAWPQAPAPITAELFSFPGSVWGPGSAASAGLGLADWWLGEEPAGNPATVPRRWLTLSPAMLRVSRQDLRAENRGFDEQPVFFDVAGGWLGFPSGSWGFGIYGYQPVVRLEDNAFQRGQIGGPTPPALLHTRSAAREIRAGLAASYGLRSLRLGAAAEWTRRDDEYFVREQSGSPDQGEREVRFSGDGYGFHLGARLDLGAGPRSDGAPRGGSMTARDPPARRVTLGGTLRFVPALDLKGEQRLVSLVVDSLAVVTAERERGWEGGFSARYAATESFRIQAGFGARSSQEWHGFGVVSGGATAWAAAIEYHDARDPWTLRFGLGRERQDDVPEPRAVVVGIGFGWQLESTRIDLGLLRRSLERPGRPTSLDDRGIATITIPF